MKNSKFKIQNYLFLLSAFCYLLPANLSAFTLLKDISVKSEANKDSISVGVSSKTKYNIFRIDKPNRLVIDLTDCETAKKDFKDATQFITNIRAAQYKETPVKKARIVIDLRKTVRFSAKSTDTEIIVEITERKQEVGSRKSTTATTSTVKPKAVQKTTPTVSKSVVAPKELPSVTQTEPVKTLETVKSTETVKPKATTTSRKPEVKPNIPDKKHLATVKEIKEAEATGKKQEVTKTEKKSAPKKEEQKTTAKQGDLPKDPVTLDFTDADIKDVLQILAVKTGMNIIYSDDVSGTLSLHLENVPFDEAMNLILQMKGLVLQQVASNVLRVMTPQTLAKERLDSVQVTQIFRLSYSKAPDMSGKLTSIMTAESQKVTIQTDERTNSIIVTSTPEGLLATASLINKLDIKPEQVLIEAKIVEITVGDTKDLGIDWTFNKTETPGSATITEDAVSMTPAQSTVGSFTFGYLKSDIALTARLTAAQSKGNAKILSQPRIATLNNLEAKIVVGDQIPYAQTTIGIGGISTQSTAFMTVGIQLTVTPTINADGRITMKVKPTVSYATRITAIGPQVSTREAETTVLVRNGETIVIGGMITDQERKDVSQIPLLGDLPILGHFFKSQHHDKTKTELLVFVTPYIMKE